MNSIGRIKPATELPPERWVVVGVEGAWLDSARELLERMQHPLAAWRVLHGLVQVVDSSAFRGAVQAALQASAPVVHVFFEAFALQDVDALLDDLRPEGQRRRVRLTRLRQPDALARSLQSPDGLAAEQWLMGGRRELPVIGLSEGNEDFTRAATSAFGLWADEFLAHNDAEELDVLYGSGEDQSDETELPEVEQPVPGQGQPEFHAVPARRMTATPWVMAPMPLRADSRGTPSPWTLSGVLDKQHAEGEVDRYRLSASARIVPGAEGNALKVTLQLDYARWAGRRKLLMELHPLRRLPLLVPLGDVEQQKPLHGVVTLTARCDADQALLEALSGSVVRITFDNAG